MKFFKKIIAWAILSVILQVGVLIVLDQFVLKMSSDFKSKKIDVNVDNTKDIKATVPTNAENVNISYDGKYLTYSLDKKLYMEDSKTAEKKEVVTEDNGTILYYEWLTDRDRIIIAEKIKSKGVEKIKLVTYTPQSATETPVIEVCNFEANMEVKKITESTITGVYYIDVYRGGMKSTVYRIDINNDLSKVSLQANVLGNMQVIPHVDRLIYEDAVNNTFFATSPNKKLTFNSNKKLTLLGIDRNDVIYMGEVNGDKISSLIYGKMEEDTSKWKTLQLNAVVGKDDLYFTNNSEILINDNLKGSVKNLTTGTEIEYEGKLVEIKESFIATVDNDGKITYKSLDAKKK